MTTAATTTPDPGALEPTTPGGGPPTPSPERIRRSGPETWSIPVPLVGTLELSGPELAYVGGIVGLAALGLLEWPIGLVIAGGHLLAADRSSRTVRDLGAAMTEAD